MADEAIKWEVKDGLGTVTLNRPEKRNAINDEVLHRITSYNVCYTKLLRSKTGSKNS